MTNMKKWMIGAFAFIMGFSPMVKANEGMWLPMFVDRLNYQDMKNLGLQLTPEEIYNVNKSSLKDAIVMLSGGSCTAEMISSEGLVLTNHHCAYRAIQENSSKDKDLLTDGFWAMKRGDELQAKGMTASFLVRMEDVSKIILPKLTGLDEVERAKMIQSLSDSIRKAAVEDTHYNASVKDFFGGNEFYLFVYETFKDVRLVGVPPSSIGKFGGDTDNWMWPRHTGDFTMLRIYTDKEGKPADYSTDNVPLRPKHHLPIAMDGVKKDDYAMIMGYPGRTDRYLTSFGVRQAVEKEQPARVNLRGARLETWKKGMDADAEVRIKYAAKYAGVSNYWKYFMGQTAQVKNNRVIDKKEKEEAAFTAWVNADPKRKEKYGEALDLLRNAYAVMDEYVLINTYIGEAIFGSEILLQAYRMEGLRPILEPKNPDAVKLNAAIQSMKARNEAFYKDYEPKLDQEATARLLEITYNTIDHKFLPKYFLDMVKKNKNDFNKLSASIFAKSVVGDQAKMDAFLKNPKKKTMDNDPAIRLASAFMGKYRGEVVPNIQNEYMNIEKGNRLFIAGLREMNTDKKYYPNANSTMRLTYGRVLNYDPRDAVHYNYISTIEGVFQKEDPNNDEFVVPAKLKELYEKKDYGNYAGKDGQLYLNFITDNDITGGNSGSPVINAKGHLIGCAFDGNWEAMSGDIFFETKVQRTIAVDIRYILFIVDKFAGAKHLVNEMTLVYEADETQNVSLPIAK